MEPYACSSSCFRTTLCEASRTVSPSATMPLARAINASIRKGRRAGHFAASQFLLRDAGRKRLLQMESPERSVMRVSAERSHSRSSRRNSGWFSATKASDFAACSISPGSRPVEAINSAMPSPYFDSRTSSANALFERSAFQHAQAARDRLAAPVAAARDIHHHAAADGHDGRKHADDEAVARKKQQGLAEHEAHVLARRRAGAGRRPPAAGPPLPPPPCRNESAPARDS